MPSSGELKQFKCRSCGSVVGRTDGNSIYLGNKTEPVPLHPTHISFPCPFCRAKIDWVRVKKLTAATVY